MAIKKFFSIFVFSIIFLTFFSCKSVHDIHDDFTDISVKVNVALQVHLVIRTEDIIPDKFFIQNLQTYKMYEMTLDSKNMFYYQGLPIGTYRVGYWLASHNTGSPVFRCCGFADCLINIPYNKNSSSNLSLGVFYQQCSVSNLNVKCGKTYLHSQALTLDHNGTFAAIPEENITNKQVSDNVIFTKYGCGKAEYYDDNYEILSSYIDNMAKYESEIIYSYLHVIDKEYRKKGLESAAILIQGYLANRYNDYLPVKLAQLYYNENQLEQCNAIINEMYEKNTNFPEYYGLQAMLAYKNGQTDNALSLFYKAVSLGSRWAEVYDSYANLLIEQNNIQMAKLLSDYSLQIDANNIKSLNTNLQICKILNDTKRENILNKVIKKITAGGK